MIGRSLSVLSLVLVAAGAAAAGPGPQIGTPYTGPETEEPAGRVSPLVGTYKLLRGGPVDMLVVAPRGDGRYTVVRSKTCFPSGHREVLRGVGQIRRGVLLVDFHEHETHPPLPGFDPSTFDADTANGVTQAPQEGAPTGDAGGLIGVLEGGGPAQAPEGERPKTGVSLSASVGLGGVNRADDVETVQLALSDRAFLSLSQVTLGEPGQALNEAIRRYQIAKVGYRYPDSRVDVDNKTIAALNGAELGPRAYIVYGSVGQGGINAAEDVETIAAALTAGGYLQPGYGGSGGDATFIAAIRRYQVERAGFRVGDGRVDINHRTLAALNGESFAEAPGAISDPTDRPLGEPLADEEPAPQQPQAPSAADTGEIPADADPLTAFLGSFLPAVPEGQSVAAYSVGGDRIHGVVSSAACGLAGRWVQDHGQRLVSEPRTK